MTLAELTVVAVEATMVTCSEFDPVEFLLTRCGTNPLT